MVIIMIMMMIKIARMIITTIKKWRNDKTVML